MGDGCRFQPLIFQGVKHALCVCVPVCLFVCVAFQNIIINNVYSISICLHTYGMYDYKRHSIIILVYYHSSFHVSFRDGFWCGDRFLYVMVWCLRWSVEIHKNPLMKGCRFDPASSRQKPGNPISRCIGTNLQPLLKNHAHFCLLAVRHWHL